MKHLNEIGRIKELMSLINEGEALKFLDRLLKRGETNSIKKAEGAIDDVFQVLDDETISKLESLGIRDATDLGSNLSSLSEDLAANVARGLMRNSTDYSKMFFNLLRNNDSYDTVIKGLEDLIEKNASKIKTQADVNKIIDALGSKSGWDPVVIFNVKQNVKPKVNISDLVDTGADVSKFMKNVYAVLGGEKNYEMVMKYVLGLLGITAVIGFIPLGLGTKAMDWWNNRGKEPQFMDDELIKKIVNGTLDSDFETYFPEYSLAISDSFKNTLSQRIIGIKSQTQSPYELKLDDEYFKTIPDGFHLKYVLDYAKSQFVNIVKDDIIDQSIDNISKPFYIYKPLASINSETEFQSFEMNREELVKKYTTIKRKCPNETTWTDVKPSEDIYNTVNKSVIGYLLNKKKSSVKGAIDIVDKKAKDALGIDLESEVMTEEALKEKINKSLGSSPIFADDIKKGCEFNYSFLIPESKKGLINILEQFGPKKKDKTNVNKGNTSGPNSASETGGNAIYNEIEKDYPTITTYNRFFKFYTDNDVFKLNSQEKEFGDILVKTNDKKMLGYNLPTAFIKSVVEINPQITKVSVPEKIGNDKVELQFEFFKRIKGLQTILEQAQTPVKYITYKIVDGKLKKPTEDDNWIDGGPNTTIEFIAKSSKTVLRAGQRSKTVMEIKKTLDYPKDGTPPEEYSPYFTADFNTFLIKYKGTNGLVNTDGNTDGNIDQKLICSIKEYQKYCTPPTSTTAPPTSTTAPPTSTTAPPTSTTVIPTTEMKYLNDYAKYVGDGIPAYGPCKSLFDYYSQQALNYIRLKKVNKEPKDTEAIKKQLEPIKEKILYCQKSSNLKDRAKLDSLISIRYRIQQDKYSPYYVDI